jgi:hypothetical protein
MPELAPSDEAQAAARRTWIRHLADQRDFDKELSQILLEASKEAERRVAAIIGDGVGAATRRAQLQVAVATLKALSGEMWGSIDAAMAKEIERAAQLGVDGLMALDSILLRAIGDVGLRQSIVQGANFAANNVMSRIINDIKLSPNVYRTQALANKWVEQTLNSMIASNSSAAEIAKAVKSMIDPRVPGGVSFAARRLARTEINNAFHTTTIRAAAEQPWVEGFKWNLSGSHPRPDPCDDFANDDTENLGAGIFSPSNVPGKPHPQCLCYLTTIVVDDEELINGLATGRYDSWLEERAGIKVDLGDEMIDVVDDVTGEVERVPARFVRTESSGYQYIDRGAMKREREAERDRLWESAKRRQGARTDDESRSMNVYQSSFGTFQKINNSLRDGTPLDDVFRMHVKNVDEVIAKSVLPEGMTLHRGMAFKTSKEYREFMDGISEGGAFMDRAYFSTTLDSNIAGQFGAFGESPSVRIELRVSAGQTGAILDGDEMEILLPRDQRWRVISIIDEVGLKGKPKATIIMEAMQ